MFPRVKEVIDVFDNGGIEAVKKYYNQPQMEIDPSTWSGYIKRRIDANDLASTSLQLAIMSEKFKSYKNVSKEERAGTDSGSIDREGYSQIKE